MPIDFDVTLDDSYEPDDSNQDQSGSVVSNDNQTDDLDTSVGFGANVNKPPTPKRSGRKKTESKPKTGLGSFMAKPKTIKVPQNTKIISDSSPPVSTASDIVRVNSKGKLAERAESLIRKIGGVFDADSKQWQVPRNSIDSIDRDFLGIVESDKPFTPNPIPTPRKSEPTPQPIPTRPIPGRGMVTEVSLSNTSIDPYLARKMMLDKGASYNAATDTYTVPSNHMKAFEYGTFGFEALREFQPEEPIVPTLTREERVELLRKKYEAAFEDETEAETEKDNNIPQRPTAPKNDTFSLPGNTAPSDSSPSVEVDSGSGSPPKPPTPPTTAEMPEEEPEDEPTPLEPVNQEPQKRKRGRPRKVVAEPTLLNEMEKEQVLEYNAPEPSTEGPAQPSLLDNIPEVVNNNTIPTPPPSAVVPPSATVMPGTQVMPQIMTSGAFKKKEDVAAKKREREELSKRRRENLASLNSEKSREAIEARDQARRETAERRRERKRVLAEFKEQEKETQKRETLTATDRVLKRLGGFGLARTAGVSGPVLSSLLEFMTFQPEEKAQDAERERQLKELNNKRSIELARFEEEDLTSKTETEKRNAERTGRFANAKNDLYNIKSLKDIDTFDATAVRKPVIDTTVGGPTGVPNQPTPNNNNIPDAIDPQSGGGGSQPPKGPTTSPSGSNDPKGFGDSLLEAAGALSDSTKIIFAANIAFAGLKGASDLLTESIKATSSVLMDPGNTPNTVGQFGKTGANLAGYGAGAVGAAAGKAFSPAIAAGINTAGGAIFGASGGALVGTALAPGLGTIIGFVAGKVISDSITKPFVELASALVGFVDSEAKDSIGPRTIESNITQQLALTLDKFDRNLRLDKITSNYLDSETELIRALMEVKTELIEVFGPAIAAILSTLADGINNLNGSVQSAPGLLLSSLNAGDLARAAIKYLNQDEVDTSNNNPSLIFRKQLEDFFENSSAFTDAQGQNTIRNNINTFLGT